MTDSPEEAWAIVHNHLWHAKQVGVHTGPALAALASLRTQLQQAEQERDAAVHELEVIENFGVLPLYNALLAAHSETVSQLQQAETALREIADAQEDWTASDAGFSRLQSIADVALAGREVEIR